MSAHCENHPTDLIDLLTLDELSLPTVSLKIRMPDYYTAGSLANFREPWMSAHTLRQDQDYQFHPQLHMGTKILTWLLQTQEALATPNTMVRLIS